LSELNAREQMGLVSAFSTLTEPPDYLVVDTGPGIGSMVRGFCAAADIVLVVICDEPASLANGRALIDLLASERGIRRFHVVCNRVRSRKRGWLLFEKFYAECGYRLDVNMHHVASIPEDTAFAKSVRIRKAVVECDPNSPAAAALRGLARSAESWVVKSSGRPTCFTGYEARANSRSCAL
jgi:flagellar biosynthesis protein FlhG